MAGVPYKVKHRVYPNRIHEFRIAKGATLADCGLAVGVTGQAINKLEKRGHGLDAAHWLLLSEYLGVDLKTLMSRPDNTITEISSPTSVEAEPSTNQHDVIIENSIEFIKALNELANVRKMHIHRIGRYLLDRPELHAILGEVLREYPPKETHHI